jgi:hypothetical protein
MKKCNWECGRQTKNHTGICDFCWKDRESIYLARKAKEPMAEKKPISPARRAALEQARTAEKGKITEAFARHRAFLT